MSASLIERPAGLNPPALTPAYKTSILRSPQKAPISFPSGPSEETGPLFGQMRLAPTDNDLLVNYARPGETAIGERILVHGRVMDECGRPVTGALIEIWQANAGGRYRHVRDGYKAALDPGFGGCGRTIAGPDGTYVFRTVRPGAYPWPNGVNDWRPSHIHFSIFGHAFGQRLITQMYFEGDPLIPFCPIAQGIPDKAALERLVARIDRKQTKPMDAIAYRFDIVLRGQRQTWFENRSEGM